MAGWFQSSTRHSMILQFSAAACRREMSQQGQADAGTTVGGINEQILQEQPGSAGEGADRVGEDGDADRRPASDLSQYDMGARNRTK